MQGIIIPARDIKSGLTLLPNSTGLIYTVRKEANATITLTTQSISMNFTGLSGVVSWFYVSVDLTEYRTLEFDIYLEATHTDARWAPCVGVLTGAPTAITTFPPSYFTAYRKTVIGTSTYAVDISNISGVREIGMIGVAKGACTGIRLVR